MARLHAPATDDPEHAEEHAIVMIFVNGIEAGHVLHEYDAREYARPGRRRQRRVRNLLEDHMTGRRHELTVPPGLRMDELLALHEEAHR